MDVLVSVVSAAGTEPFALEFDQDVLVSVTTATRPEHCAFELCGCVVTTRSSPWSCTLSY
jgi:hypothetical protein